MYYDQIIMSYAYIPNLKYKTTQCQNWIQRTTMLKKDKQCYKGPNCHFAHGEYQLRTLEENQKCISDQNKYIQSMNEQANYPTNYKTIKCKFYSKGKCQLGESCTFVHESSERRPKPQLSHFQSFNSYPQYNSQYNMQQIQPYNEFYPQQYMQQINFSSYPNLKNQQALQGKILEEQKSQGPSSKVQESEI